jgi:tRNA nucleotidyltransferase (CCA-adding enzyme)
VTDLLDGDGVFSARLGPAVEAALEDGYAVLVGAEIDSLAGEFGIDFAEYFEPSP